MTKEEYIKLFSNTEWSFETVEKAYELVKQIGEDYLKLDIYPNQIEIVNAEQMIDAYALIGLPISYPHWKFGKDFISNDNAYQKGKRGLAYEMVINSNPCISYNQENNTTCMMTLVLAHAAMGHNSFFKCNYMFKDWTHADSIIDYMVFARDFILDCEEKYGVDEVEKTLDACHAIMDYGVDKYNKPSKISMEEEKRRIKELIDFDRESYNPIWKTLPKKVKKEDEKDAFPKQPEENILYFIEKNAPTLPPWKKEICRIVRKVAQYFYPQGLTKVMNEGWASMSHYLIMNKLFDDGYVNEGFMLEFLDSHSSVLFQPEYNKPYFSGINPYTLGFNIFMDIKRMCENPTEEDKKWFPNLVGKDWLEEVHYAMRNFRDDSFILQYLSPKVIRDMKLFMIEDFEDDDHYTIGAIHNERGYEKVREELSKQYHRTNYVPIVEVTKADLYTDRTLELTHKVDNGKLLALRDAKKVVHQINYLWEFPVVLRSSFEDGKSEEIYRI